MEKLESEIGQDITDTLIKMPEDLEKVKRLCFLLTEGYKQKEAENPSSLDFKYESAILRGVLSKGITSYNELFKEISPKDKTVFSKAFNVIRTCISNGSI